MASILYFAFLIIHYLLQAVVWVLVANAILSWLIAFDVINMRNRIANQVVRGLDAVVRPMLKPLRRFIPPLGGVDITPMILIILIMAIDQALLPGLFVWLGSVLGA